MGLDIVKVAKETEEITQKSVRSWFNRLSKEKQRKMTINQEVLDLIEESVNDPVFDGFKFIDTLITYQSALEGTRGSLKGYVEALRFCSFLEANEGNAVDAYIKAFSHKDFVKARMGFPSGSQQYTELTATSTRYRKTPLVVNILTQAEVPLYLMFQGYRYKAVARLAYEMENASLARDRITSADRLLTHLQPPEGLKVEVDINDTKGDIIDTYEEMMKKMVTKKRELMLDGGNIVEITNQSVRRVDEVTP